MKTIAAAVVGMIVFALATVGCETNVFLGTDPATDAAAVAPVDAGTDG